ELPHRHGIPAVTVRDEHPCSSSPARAAMLSAIQGDPGEAKSKTIFAFASSFAVDVPPLESAEHRSPRRSGSRSEARQEPKPFRRARDGASESPTRARSAGYPRSGRSMGHVFFGYYSLTCVKESNPPIRGGTKLSIEAQARFASHLRKHQHGTRDAPALRWLSRSAGNARLAPVQAQRPSVYSAQSVFPSASAA
ncbi:MAG: hypothetical protein JWR16_2305, partial [Nevskia sp.]|nr:hypothetical protein [Nevskia sp.]